MSATVMSFCNQKGGVGKTSTTALVSYNLAKMGFKCLVIDFDPQANITQLFLKTHALNHQEVKTIDQSLMAAMKNDASLNSITINIMDNLYLVPTAVDFSLYDRFLQSKFDNEEDRISYFRKYLERDVIDEYDFIFVDVPPTLGLSNDTAFYACDQIVIVLQTQERSLSGAEYLLQYLQEQIIDHFGSNVDVLGILPVLSKRDAAVDKEILNASIEEFGAENIFNSRVMIMERVKRMDITGITDNPKDIWDQRTHKPYRETAEEILERLHIEKRN